MAKREWTIEISGTDKKFYILAYHRDTKDTHLIELFLRQGTKLLKTFDNNYHHVMKRLKIVYGKMIFKDLNQSISNSTLETKPRLEIPQSQMKYY